MGCAITFHDRVGPERLAEAVSPQAVEELHALLT